MHFGLYNYVNSNCTYLWPKDILCAPSHIVHTTSFVILVVTIDDFCHCHNLCIFSRSFLRRFSCTFWKLQVVRLNTSGWLFKHLQEFVQVRFSSVMFL